MAKPILVVRTPNYNKELGKLISAGVNNEYHVLIVAMPEDSEVSFETHNAERLNSLEMKDLKKAVFEHNKARKPKPTILSKAN
jgi:hypothetical protein